MEGEGGEEESREETTRSGEVELFQASSTLVQVVAPVEPLRTPSSTPSITLAMPLK